MIQINPSDEDVKAFQYERINHPHPRVMIRMDVLWLKTNELPHQQIAEIAGVCKNTATCYLRMYNEGGIEKLREVNFYKPQSDLSEHILGKVIICDFRIIVSGVRTFALKAET